VEALHCEGEKRIAREISYTSIVAGFEKLGAMGGRCLTLDFLYPLSKILLKRKTCPCRGFLFPL
jgi:hypothetical protein